MTVEGVRLVLGQHRDLGEARVRQVRQHEVDEPIGTAERNGWFGTVHREGHEAFALAASEDDGQNLGTRLCHGPQSTATEFLRGDDYDPKRALSWRVCDSLTTRPPY